MSKPFIASIESLSHDGRGITRINGKTTFVDGALPGETVEARFRRKRAKFNEAYVSSVIEPSAERVTPACKVFDMCGGCSLQHISPEQQRDLKQMTLLEHLKHFGNVAPQEVVEPMASAPWGYRRKARLAVRVVHGKGVLVGFRETNGRFITQMDDCKVLHPRVASLIPALKVLIENLSCAQSIPQIEVAVGDDVGLVFRHLEALQDVDIEKLKAFEKEHDLRLYLQSKDYASVVPLNQDNPLLLHYMLPEFNLRLDFHPLDFVQVNAKINENMIQRALAWLDVNENDTVLDLFCGLGNFSLPLARKAKHVVGVEGEAVMVERAAHNAALNDLSNTEFVVANLDEDISHLPFTQKRFDKVLLDPARSGASEIISYFKTWQPEKIVYVSCNPATLARDAKAICERGYTLVKAGIMDMFPHTKHVESIALFNRVGV